jgi:hypothetical protein
MWCGGEEVFVFVIQRFKDYRVAFVNSLSLSFRAKLSAVSLKS